MPYISLRLGLSDYAIIILLGIYNNDGAALNPSPYPFWGWAFAYNEHIFGIRKGCFILCGVDGETLSEKGARANIECEEHPRECTGVDIYMRLGFANSAI